MGGEQQLGFKRRKKLGSLPHSPQKSRAPMQKRRAAAVSRAAVSGEIRTDIRVSKERVGTVVVPSPRDTALSTSLEEDGVFPSEDPDAPFEARGNRIYATRFGINREGLCQAAEEGSAPPLPW